MRLGIDVGGTKVAAVVMDSAGCVVDSQNVAWRGQAVEPLPAIETVLQSTWQFSREHGIAIESVGVSLAAWMNTDRSEVVAAANLPGLTCKRIRRMVRAVLGVGEVVFENDGSCAAVGEQIHNSIESQVTAVIGLGTGVAGGLAHLGAPLRVGNPGAEFGHMPVAFDTDARTCVCGGSGCLETKIGGLALATSFPDSSRSNGAVDQHMAAYIASWLRPAIMQIFSSVGPSRFVFFGPVAERLWPALYPDLVSGPWPLTATTPKPVLTVSDMRGLGPAVGAAYLGGVGR